MADFSNFKAVNVSSESVVEYELRQIEYDGDVPTIIVAPATNVNKRYMNAMLKVSSKITQQLRSGRIDTNLLDANRENDRVLYSKFIIKNWKNIVEANGKNSEYTIDNCRDFLKALPDWIFDELRTFCGNSSNFVETFDVNSIAKN